MLSAPNLGFWNKMKTEKRKSKILFLNFLNINSKLKIEKEMSFYNFQFWIEIDMRKNALFHFSFNLKIEWDFRCTDCFFTNFFLCPSTPLILAPKVPFNLQIKIEMKKGIFAHFNFNSKLKIKKRHFFFNFPFPIFI